MSVDSISKEVKQFEREMQVEDLKSKAGQNKGAIVLFIALVAIIFIGYTWYENYRKEVIAREGAEFMTASMKMRVHEDDEAKRILTDLFENGISEYSSAAGFHVAAMDVYATKYEEAANKYKKISDNRSYRQAARDYAKYMYIVTKLQNDKNYDMAAIDELKKYVAYKPIFAYNAYELLMSIYISHENYTEAQRILDLIQNDANLPQPLKLRAMDIGSGIESSKKSNTTNSIEQ